MKKKGNALAQSMGPVATEKDMEWETKDHHETMMKAMEIMADPEKMKRVRKMAGKRKKAISSLKELHDTYQQKYGIKAEIEEDDED